MVLWEGRCGREIFSGKTASDTLASVLTKDVDLSTLPPETLFSFRDAGLEQRDFGFDVTPDGKGFVVTRDVPDEANRAVITVVTDWIEESRK